MKSIITLVVAALLVATMSTGAVANSDTSKASFSFKGFTISDFTLKPRVPTGSVDMNWMRLIPSWKKDSLTLIAFFQPNISPEVSVVMFQYRCPWFTIEAGRMPTLHCVNLTINPLDRPHVIFPLSRLDMPPFDNGAFLKGTHDRFNFGAGFFNGSGGYRDDNNHVDWAGYWGFLEGNFNLRFTFQTGWQPKHDTIPEGRREMWAFNASWTSGPLTVRAVGIHRPDINSWGEMTEANFCLGQKDKLAATGDYVEGQSQITKRLDIGWNRQWTKELNINCHVLASNESSLLLVMRVKYAFSL